MKNYKISKQVKIEFVLQEICKWCPIFKQPELDVKLRITTLHEHTKKIVFEAMGCCFHLCPRQEARPSLTVDDIKRRTQKCYMDVLRKYHNREKLNSIEKMWERSWYYQFKSKVDIKNHVRNHFLFKKLFTVNSLM